MLGLDVGCHLCALLRGLEGEGRVIADRTGVNVEYFFNGPVDDNTLYQRFHYSLLMAWKYAYRRTLITRYPFFPKCNTKKDLAPREARPALLALAT